MPEGTKTQQEWIELGWTPWMAEAFEGRELTEEQVREDSMESVMDEVLEWHGIIGFTSNILEAIQVSLQKGKYFP